MKSWHVAWESRGDAISRKPRSIYYVDIRSTAEGRGHAPAVSAGATHGRSTSAHLAALSLEHSSFNHQSSEENSMQLSLRAQLLRGGDAYIVFFHTKRARIRIQLHASHQSTQPGSYLSHVASTPHSLAAVMSHHTSQ